MKKSISVLTSLLFVAVLLIGVTNCKKSNPTFELSSLVAGTVNLNAATAPTDVPPDATIEADFNLDVDAATVNNTVITLVRLYDTTTISMTITVTGKKITMVPGENLGNGSQYTLSFLTGIKATDGQMLTAFDRSFTTVGQFVPSGVVAYWNFENNANDQVGTYSPTADGIIDMTYEASHTTAAGQAASFNGTTSLIEIPNGDIIMDTHDFSLTFWVKAVSANKTNDQFVMGLAGWFGFQFQIMAAYDQCKLAAQYDEGGGLSASEDLWFPADGNLGWQGWTFCRDLTNQGGLAFLVKDKWANIACVYNSTTKVGTMYINGVIEKSQDFNLWPDGDPKRGVVGLKYAGNAGNNHFVFGFIQDKTDPTIPDAWAQYSDPTNGHFQGMLDDVRIFHKALSANEVQKMYETENQ